jgi:hypothetical protein
MINAERKVPILPIGHFVRPGDLVAIGGEADMGRPPEIGRY